MKKSSQRSTTLRLEMTPMIDVVFQLLVFFLFTFKIAPVEGEIGVNMPPVDAGSAQATEEVTLDRTLIRLIAGPGGALAEVRFGENELGSGEVALRALAKLLRETYAGPADIVDDVEIDIDADRTLAYRWVIRAANAVMSVGIEKINFADPALSQSP